MSIQFKRTSVKPGFLCATAVTLLCLASPAVQAQLPAVAVFGARIQVIQPATSANPGKVTRDAAGNLYFIDPGTPRILEVPVSGPIQVILPSTDASLTGLANNVTMTADPAGNIYVIKTSNAASAAGASAVTEVPRLANGTYNTSAEVAYGTALGSLTGGYYQTADAAVDSLGNLYIATTAGTSVTNAAGTWTGKGILMVGPSAPAGKYLEGAAAAPTHAPTSITVDASGNVFYADTTSVYEITAANIASATQTSTPVSTPIGYYSGGPTCTGCTALTTPTYVFLDNVGNLFVTNTTNVYVIVNNGSYSTSNKTYVLPNTTISSRTYGAVDNQGNLFLAYGGALEYYGGGKLWAASATNPQIAGSVPVGTVSATTYASASIGLLFTQATTLNATTPFAVVAAGSAFGGTGTAQLNYTAGNANTTCAAGTTYAVGATCNIEVGYQPKYPGAFTGSLAIYGGATSSATNLLTSVIVNGIGSGPGITIDTGAKTVIGTGYAGPTGVAVDNAGSMYVADSVNNTVYKYAAGSTTAGTSYGTGLSGPSGVAIDPSGNLYIADTGNNRVVYLPNNNGTFGTQAILATGTFTLSAPRGVATDAFGNVYIADTGNSRVLLTANPLLGAAGTLTVTVGTGFTSPYGIAVDFFNNVFVADKGANAVYEVPGGYGMISTATVNAGPGAQVSIGTGLSAPTGVAVDGSGSVYVADGGNSRVVKIPNLGGTITSASQTTLLSSLAKPFGIAADLTADLYITDFDLPSLYYMQRSVASGGVAATLPFGSVVAGGTNTLPAIVTNSGNQWENSTSTVKTLAESVSTAAAAPFSQGTASSNDCGSASPLSWGASCNLSLTFTAPATVGTNSTGSLTLTDSALSVTTTTTKINLTGYTSGAVTAVTITGDASVTYGEAETYTVTAKDAAGNPSAAANGSYTVSITGTATSSASVTLSGGTGTFFLPSLGVGTYSLGITVATIAATPLAVSITTAPLAIMPTSTSRIFDQVNPAFGLTYTGFVNGDTSSVVSGTSTPTTAASRVSPAGTYTLTEGGTPTAANYSITTSNGTLTVSGSAPQNILFDSLPGFASGSTVQLVGIATSGLPLTYTVSSGTATISGNALTVTGATGSTISIQASQPGNSSYAAATAVTRSFTAQ